ncbi:hypothetical protein [Actinacidiphila bryophytorum]|uniref:hypothetical protein n=1 Tax=Actinacidiphila bryophytorum TaxID=1436133 RepID=UPI002176C6BB|nr:hypothetical protein [Actinacidiphila bryophytorum]UWE11616.1 hypothetical protein NYE86_24870 [Actinacidiphila bryophytorum]
MYSRGHRNQSRSRAEPESAGNVAPAPAGRRSIGPRDLLRLQRLAGNRAVVSAASAGAPGYVVQRALVSVDQWRESHDEELVRGVPFLGQLEENLRLYYAATGSDEPATVDVLRALSVLMRADSPGEVDPANLKIKRYLLRRMAFEAKRLLQNMTSPEDQQAKLEFTAEEHLKDREFVQTILDEGSRQIEDTLLHNACEWILAGRTELYVFTRTGDSLERASASGEGDRIPHVPDNFRNRGHMLAGPEPLYEAGKLDSGKNIRYLAKEDRGIAGTGYIGVARPREVGRGVVEETLRHEVQHVADRSVDVQHGRAKKSARYLFESYATEYRAYSYEGPTFSHLSDDPGHLVRKSMAGSAEYGWTERQWAIFNKIYGQYEHTQDGWNDDLPDALPGMSFRQAVLSYVDPDERGFNRLNSIRIDDFYDALHQVPLNTTNENLAAVRDVKARARALKPQEAHVVTTAGPMRNKIEEHLGGAALQEVTAILVKRGARYGQLRQLGNTKGTRNLKGLADL